MVLAVWNYILNLDLWGFFLLGPLLKDCFLPPANNSGSRLGFRNRVPMVAHQATPHFLVMIKLFFWHTLACIWLSEVPWEMSDPVTDAWDQSIHVQLNESRHVTGACPWNMAAHIFESYKPHCLSAPIDSPLLLLVSSCATWITWHWGKGEVKAQ